MEKGNIIRDFLFFYLADTFLFFIFADDNQIQKTKE